MAKAKNIIGTIDVMGNLKREPDVEQEYTFFIGGPLRSTHWLIYDSKRNLVGNSTDWDEYDWTTEEEFLKNYEGRWWRRDH